MMRPASNHSDPYDYPYRDPYHPSYRDYYRDPAGYRDTYSHREAYPDPRQYGEYNVRDYATSRVPKSAVPQEAATGKGISNRTNSDDFASKDSRLFVGNLNTLSLTKEDVNGIFGRLGTVTGISMHKGYAFVQFNTPGEARRALALENGQTYAGQALDLNIVSQPKTKGTLKRSSETRTHDVSKRLEDGAAVGPAAKRPRPDGLNPAMQRGNLVTLANNDHSSPTAHKKPGGRQPWREEPEEVGCSQCSAVFSSAWSLCLHAQQRHSVTIFRTSNVNNIR